MCGIAGIFTRDDRVPDLPLLERMISALSHRGPDGFGFFLENHIGLAHARLSIIDLDGGWQPIHNEDKTLWIIFNGEIFNYLELRAELEAKGHKFYTNSDTEVIIHLYEEKGPDALQEFNGQFSFAIYDTRENSLFLARDRVGIHPLFYTFHEGDFYFASEIKSIFSASPEIPRQIDPIVLSEIFTFWVPSSENTIFKGVRQLPPGHCARINKGADIQTWQYWDIPFSNEFSQQQLSEEVYAENLRELLVDAVRLRLRADVPVGAYLSGGLDSSTITSLIHNYTDNRLKTFSVTFEDAVYDERNEQQQMVDFLQTDHHSVDCSYKKISEAFPEVIWHTEVPVLRTAPTPLYFLSGLVRQKDYKVVLTGEGADEFLGGYDIFKEAKIRAFIHRNQNSSIRPYLLKRLYPYLALSPTRSAEYAKQFFATDASPNDPFYAFRPRWKTTSQTHLFFIDDVKKNMQEDALENKLEAHFSSKINGLDYFSRAQYIEAKLLLGNYLLASQGDRMCMAHSVEGRFPFLDHRVIEFACTIPPKMRMKVLNEKNILKKSMRDLLPAPIVSRKKQPYMAPDILSFFGEHTPAYLDYYLSPELLQEAGLFRPSAVSTLIQKCQKGTRQGFRENMAFVGILSTQILFDKFIKNFQVDMPSRLKNVMIMK